MNSAPDNPKWILKCRDLVELYYGARMVTATRHKTILFSASVQAQILTVDPRRIGFNLVLGNEGAASILISISDTQTDIANNALLYDVPVGGSILVNRSFLSDLDSVSSELWMLCGDTNLDVSVRETFLTPLPEDES
jgi:hypothetical protein